MAAREDMAPSLAEVEARTTETVTLKDEVMTLNKVGAGDTALAQFRERLVAVERAARVTQAKAA